MAGKAILTCGANSHPFQERTLILEQPAKIGRAVARARSAPTNAIFDCKVLSRNHAMVWYSNGKFFLQDTRSSNGTFVNNQRLSKSGEQSNPREVCSGDIVQFGVNVMENSRKVTHGCIIANITLFLPDGKEAKSRCLSPSLPPSLGPLPVEQLYLLNQCIQEAAQREQMLESKLIYLQETLDKIREATDQGWKALISEDRLLSRVQMLENRLQTYSKNFSEDNLREEVRKLQDDKAQYQTTAKDFLKKVLEEKVEAVQKYQEIKRSLESLEEEYNSVCEQLTKSKSDINDIAQKLSLQIAKNNELEAKIQVMEDQHDERPGSEYPEVLLQGLCDKIGNEEFQEQFSRVMKGESDLITSFSERVRRTSESEVSESSIPSTTDTISEDDASIEDMKKSSEDQAKTNVVDQSTVDKLLKENCKEVLDLFSAQLNFLHNSEKWQGEWSDLNKNGHVESDASKETDIESSSTEESINVDEEDDEVIDDYDKSTVKSDGEEKAQSEAEMCEVRTEFEVGSAEIQYHSRSEKGSRDTGTLVKQPIHSSTSLSEEEISALKQQLIEAQQAAKQSRNEAAQLISRIESLTRELELKNVLNDNKTKEELEETKQECFRLQGIIETLHSQILSLKEEREKSEKEDDSKRKTDSEKESPRNEDQAGLNDACLQESGYKSDQEGSPESKNLKELLAKVICLEEELVLVKSHYMACNEEKSRISRDYKKIKSDYEALTHQPYFNFIFSLPCIILFLAVILSFYPTLSSLTGTSDNSSG